MELLKADSLRKFFEARKIFGGARDVVKAVDCINFSIGKDSVLALVGKAAAENLP